jgi:hypothetical protein
MRYTNLRIIVFNTAQNWSRDVTIAQKFKWELKLSSGLREVIDYELMRECSG